MTQEELKPCPFCGGEAEYHSDKGPTGEVYGWVGCNQCDAMSCHIDTRSMQPEEQHPIDAWNTRAPDDHPNVTDYRNRAERAEAELAEVRDTIRIAARWFEQAAITAIQPAIDAAREEGRTTERDAIVAWLRGKKPWGYMTS